MKKFMAVIVVAMVLFTVVPVQAADSIVENLGVGANAWLGAQNGANNTTNLYVGKDMFAQTGSKSASMDLTFMMNGDVNAGKGGTAVLRVGNTSFGSQYVGTEVLTQDMAALLDLSTSVTKNGSSVASVAFSGGETASDRGKLAVGQLIVVGFSASVAMPSYCGPAGTATSNVDVNVCEGQTVVGSSCPPTPCQTPVPTPCQ